MFPLDIPPLFPTFHCDDGPKRPPAPDQKRLSTAISAVKGAISVQESELKRWKRIFDTHAKPGEDGERYVMFLPVGLPPALNAPLGHTLPPPEPHPRFFLNPSKVLGHRIIRQGHRSFGGLDQNRKKTVRHLVSCRGYLQTRFGVLGRFRGIRDVVEAA